MTLLDSNILIYATRSEHDAVRDFIDTLRPTPGESAISYVEVLGYHRLTESDRQYLERLFASFVIHPITDEVVTQAVRLRQARKMDLGDSIVAATALVHRRTLVTRNTKDFDHIDGLTLHNPFPTG